MPIRSLQKGIDILFLFNPERPSMTVEEIAQCARIPVPTAYRFVKTLREKGLLEPESRPGHYCLGLKLLELEEVIHRTMDLESVSIPRVKELAAKTGETVQLTVINADRGMCIYVEESPSALRIAPEKGRTLPLHAGASVQAILAFLPEDDQKRICEGPLKRFTPNTITDPRVLKKRLATIRDQGYVITSEEVYIGSVGIAAPLFNRDRRVIASVAVSGPTQRMTEKRREIIKTWVVRAAREISQILGLPPTVDPFVRQIG
jgi:DNA-binding IclR family transcriptional regulator